MHYRTTTTGKRTMATTKQIQTLQFEAIEHGDEAQANLCARALEGDPESMRACELAMCCPYCGQAAEERTCADCGEVAIVIDCGHCGQPAHISASEWNGEPVCAACELARFDARHADELLDEPRR